MSRRLSVFSFTVLLALGASSALSQDQMPAMPTTAPSTAPAIVADSTTPQGTLLLLARANINNDAKSVRSLLYAATPREQKVAGALMENTEVKASFRTAVTKAFGEPAANELTGGPPPDPAATAAAEQMISSAVVTIDDNKASVQLPGEPEPVKLVKVDGLWKLPIAAFVEGMVEGEVDQKVDQMHRFSEVIRQTTDEVGKGSYKTPDELDTAMNRKMAALNQMPAMGNMAPTTEPATMPSMP